MTHIWRWRKYLPERHLQGCRVLAYGRMNSALVEFEDGARYITNRYAVQRALVATSMHADPGDDNGRAT
jgi:hypothetical protein